MTKQALQVRLLGRDGFWNVDVELGERDEDTRNRMPVVVFLNEGFDGLRVAFWGIDEDEAESAVWEHADSHPNLFERWTTCADPDEGSGFHFHGRASQVRYVDDAGSGK